MGTAIGLRDDFDGASLRRLARTTKHANPARRFLALSVVSDFSLAGLGAPVQCPWPRRLA